MRAHSGQVSRARLLRLKTPAGPYRVAIRFTRYGLTPLFHPIQTKGNRMARKNADDQAPATEETTPPVEGDAAPERKKPGRKPLTLPKLSARYEKALQKLEKAREAKARIQRVDDRIAEAEAEVAEASAALNAALAEIGG